METHYASHSGSDKGGPVLPPLPPPSLFPYEAYEDLFTWFIILAAAVVVATVPGLRRLIGSKRWDTWTIIRSTKRPLLSVSILLVVLPIVGGLLNRIRGGWRPNGWCATGGDFCLRMSFCVPTGLVFGLLLGGNPMMMICITIFNFLGIVEGWGCYFGMARGMPLKSNTSHTDCANEFTRWGMFDWALGKPDIFWSFEQAYERDWAAMSMRGLVWTLPMGIILISTGERHVWALAGTLMSFVYEIGEDIPVHIPFMSQGTPLAEFIWGWTL